MMRVIQDLTETLYLSLVCLSLCVYIYVYRERDGERERSLGALDDKNGKSHACKGEREEGGRMHGGGLLHTFQQWCN